MKLGGGVGAGVEMEIVIRIRRAGRGGEFE